MAVTCKNSPIEEEAGCSCRDTSAPPQDIHTEASIQACIAIKKRKTRDDDSGSRFHIDDCEIVGYLNNAREMERKRIFWEAMNRNHMKAKAQKKATKGKKSTSEKQSVKTAAKLETKKRSSKINYDALKSLEDEL